MICVGNNSKPLKQASHCPNTVHSYRQHLSLLQEPGEQGPGLGKDTILSQCKDFLFEIIVLDFRTHWPQTIKLLLTSWEIPSIFSSREKNLSKAKACELQRSDKLKLQWEFVYTADYKGFSFSLPEALSVVIQNRYQRWLANLQISLKRQP